MFSVEAKRDTAEAKIISSEKASSYNGSTGCGNLSADGFMSIRFASGDAKTEFLATCQSWSPN
jgi:hypothetical protein